MSRRQGSNLSNEHRDNIARAQRIAHQRRREAAERQEQENAARNRNRFMQSFYDNNSNSICLAIYVGSNASI